MSGSVRPVAISFADLVSDAGCVRTARQIVDDFERHFMADEIAHQIDLDRQRASNRRS